MSVDPQVDVFLDANILVYAYDRTAGVKHDLAARLVEGCWKAENGCLSLQVLQEFYVTVTQKITLPLDHQTARQIVEDLSHWRLHTPGTGDLLQAIDFKKTFQLAFWDALVVQSASCLGCKQLLTEDLSHGQAFGEMRVIDPFREMD